jgi:hypothetical protein
MTTKKRAQESCRLFAAYLPNVIARATMEAGSQAWWLLDPEIGRGAA